MSIVLRPAATDELAALADGIRAVDPAAADRFERNVRRTLARLEAFPRSAGRVQSGNRNVRGLRVAGVRRYRQFIILYVPRRGGIEVYHIIRGMRNISQIVAND